MEKYKQVLEDLKNDKLSGGVEEGSYEFIREFKELYDQGYIKAINASADTGLSYLDPQITIPGQAYLESLDTSKPRWWHNFNSRIAVLTLIVSIIGLGVAVGLTNA